jgi:protein-disulfide isomerase
MPRATNLRKYSDPVQITPQTTNNFNAKVLVILLVIASYFLGTLTTKVSYLEKNPSSSKSVTGAEESAKPSTIPPLAKQASGKAKPITTRDHIRGNKDAKITLLEFSDLECPFCQRFHVTMQEIMKTYGDKVRWAYRHFPLSFHANAQKEAEASECVADLGGNDKFWEYIDKIFERTTANGTGFALDKLGPLAAEIGVDQTQFQSCLDSGKYEKLVKGQIEDGTKAGVSGTPATFVINSKGESQIVVGAQPIDTFKTLIDQQLEKSK